MRPSVCVYGFIARLDWFGGISHEQSKEKGPVLISPDLLYTESISIWWILIYSSRRWYQYQYQNILQYLKVFKR